MKTFIPCLIAIILFTACSEDDNRYDASGTFEAIETIVSAEATGTIHALDIREGEFLKRGTTVGYIDSIQFHLKRKQLEAQIRAVLSKRPNINTQIASLLEELQQAQREQKRVAN